MIIEHIWINNKKQEIIFLNSDFDVFVFVKYKTIKGPDKLVLVAKIPLPNPMKKSWKILLFRFNFSGIVMVKIANERIIIAVEIFK